MTTNEERIDQALDAIAKAYGELPILKSVEYTRHGVSAIWFLPNLGKWGIVSW